MIIGTTGKLYIDGQFVANVTGIKVIFESWYDAWIRRTPRG